MTEQLTCQPDLAPCWMRRLLLSLLVVVFATAMAILLSPDAARADTCMGAPPTSAASGGSTGGGDDLDCGGGGVQPPPPPPPPPPGDGGGNGSCSGVVVLYEHTSFQGRCWGFSAGETGWIGGEANDQASSIWVADGYVATLFLHASFEGPAYSTESATDPWAWAEIGNDNVSSLVVQPSAPDWSYYGGDGETVVTDASYVTATAESRGCARVGAGVHWRTGAGRRWEYALVTSFCWNGNTITSLWAREVMAIVHPIPFPLNLIQGWRYSPVAFQPGEPGYPSTVLRTDGRFEYCGFKYGCVTTVQPWVRIELRRDGTALCSTSAHTALFACERFS